MVAFQMGETTSPPKSSWQPTHIILGCWNNPTDKEIIENDAAAFISTLPANISNYLCKAYCKRSFGTIAKVPVQPSHLVETAWAIKRFIEQNKHARIGQLPTWADKEQSPEVGKRKRNTKRVVEEAKNIMPKAHIDSRGTMWHNKVEAAHWDARSCCWRQGPAWSALAMAEDTTWPQFLARASQGAAP